MPVPFKVLVQVRGQALDRILVQVRVLVWTLGHVRIPVLFLVRVKDHVRVMVQFRFQVQDKKGMTWIRVLAMGACRGSAVGRGQGGLRHEAEGQAEGGR